MQRLNDVDQNIAQPQVIAKMLELPKKYMSLVAAWDVLEDEKQTVENLLPRLLKAEKL